MSEETMTIETPDDLKLLFDAYGCRDEEALTEALHQLEQDPDE
jgi:hypothetical protein